MVKTPISSAKKTSKCSGEKKTLNWNKKWMKCWIQAIRCQSKINFNALPNCSKSVTMCNSNCSRAFHTKNWSLGTIYQSRWRLPRTADHRMSSTPTAKLSNCIIKLAISWRHRSSCQSNLLGSHSILLSPPIMDPVFIRRMRDLDSSILLRQSLVCISNFQIWLM